MQRSSTVLRPATRNLAIRRNFAHKPVRRHYATATETASAATDNRHIVSGLIGGGVTLLGVYGWYHISGTKKVVNTAQQLSQQAQDIKEKVKQSTPSPKAALGFIRSAAHSYSSAFPGAAYLVDQTFDQIDQIAEKNGPEVEKIIKQVYSDISKAASEGGDKATDKIVAAIQQAVSQIQKLGGDFGASKLRPLLEKNPQLKSALNDSLEQLDEFGGKYGPEAKKIAEDTVNQIRQLADKGLNGETIAKAAALAREKLEQIKELGAKAGSEAYSKAAEGAKPYLDKAPEVKKYFEQNIESLKEYVGDDGVKLINDTYGEIEKAGKKGDTSELLKIVKERGQQLQKLAQEKGGQVAGKASEKLGDAFPGANKLFDSVPSLKDVQKLRELAHERGGEFEKLLNETYDELKQVLESKGKKAKELGGDVAQDAKEKTGK